MKIHALRALILCLLIAGPAAACPNCKEALAGQESEESLRVANGYSYSILFMMAMPFSLLGAGVWMVTRAARRGGLPEL
jgi:uncharacterized paraquat-inducible protein A